MKIRQLVSYWQTTGDSNDSPKVSLNIKISLHDAARLAALADLFPALKSEEVIAELLHAALDEVEEAFPYVAGKKQNSEDELGNPIYEDDGYTPRFLALMRQHLAKLTP
jgi:type VI protein secretion system component VasK